MTENLQFILKEAMVGFNEFLSTEECLMCKNVLFKILMEYDLYKKDNSKQLPSTYNEENLRLKNAYLVSRKLDGLSEHTINGYNNYLNKMLNSIDCSVLTINSNQLQYIIYEYQLTGVSKSTTQNYKCYLSAFFIWLEKKGYRKDNPMLNVDDIKQEKVERQPFNSFEIEKLKNSASTPREKALIYLLFSSGIRREEVTKIKLSEINFNENSILIHGKGNKERIVYFNDASALHLQEYLEYREKNNIVCEYLFCSNILQNINGKQMYAPICTATVMNEVKAVGNRANVEDVHPHRFRRTFCCIASEKMDLFTVSRLMGHNSLNTTKGYTNTDLVKMKREYAKFVI